MAEAQNLVRVGIICEGTTDYEVLQVVVQKTVAPKIPTFTLLQPDRDRLTTPGAPRIGTGWQAVREFLKTSDAALRMDTFDLVVVHVDADFVHGDAEIEKIVARELADNEDDEPGSLDALCRHVKGWLGHGVPANVVIVLPRNNIDAWLVAVHTKLKDVEAIADPAEELAARGLLPRLGGVVQKKRAAYAKLAQPLAAFIAKSRWVQALPELARFIGKIAARQRDVLRAAGIR